MFMKYIVVCMAVALLGHAFLTMARDRAQPSEPSAYVKVEVKGKLVHKDNMYYVETSDATFSDFKLLVGLGRAEDKNRALDRHLESLEGKAVIAYGYLDCRRITQENAKIYLYLYNETQVKPVN
jgi:hypothetical protein